VRIIGELFDDQNKVIGRAMRGGDKGGVSVADADDIEA